MPNTKKITRQKIEEELFEEEIEKKLFAHLKLLQTKTSHELAEQIILNHRTNKETAMPKTLYCMCLIMKG